MKRFWILVALFAPTERMLEWAKEMMRRGDLDNLPAEDGIRLEMAADAVNAIKDMRFAQI